MNAVVLEVSNGPAEDFNSRIKMTKVRSGGFLNKERLPMRSTSTLEG
ncbi:transposase [Candidatus Vondammii sp. HM_W22]|nr:transposase [Candidatus Vondammii sp. HM_W22]